MSNVFARAVVQAACSSDVCVVLFAARAMVEATGFRLEERVVAAIAVCAACPGSSIQSGGQHRHPAAFPPAAVPFAALFAFVRVENAAERQIRGNGHSTANVSRFHTQI